MTLEESCGTKSEGLRHNLWYRNQMDNLLAEKVELSCMSQRPRLSATKLPDLSLTAKINQQ